MIDDNCRAYLEELFMENLLDDYKREENSEITPEIRDRAKIIAKESIDEILKIHYENLDKVKEMRRQKADLELLTADADMLHECIYDSIAERVPDMVGKTEVYTDRNLEDSVAYLLEMKDGNLAIAVSPELSDFDESYKAYKSFCRKNSLPVSPEDFFTYVLAHEYGHLFDLENNEGNNPALSKAEIMHGCGEGFGYWFADQMTGYNGLSYDQASTYDAHTDPEFLVRVYSFFQNVADKNGEEYVFRNFNDLF